MSASRPPPAVAPLLRLLRAPRSHPLVVPGCHDPLSARGAADAGAGTVFLAGSTAGRALFGSDSVPAHGLATYLGLVELVCRTSPVPVVVDGEDGFGDPPALLARLADAGAAGVVVGDGRPDGDLVPVGSMTDLVATAAGLGVVLVPRTDGIHRDRAETHRRLGCYRDAGAELTLTLLTTVLRVETPAQQVRTYAELACASGGTAALHSRHGAELPPLARLPAGVAAVILSGVSLPPDPLPRHPHDRFPLHRIPPRD